MSGAEIGLALSVFLACAVEAVEALTIVLAVGSTRSWSSAMSGVGAASIALAALVAAFGPALTSLPIDLLRVLVGGLLLIFGLQWLRKAVLRAGGAKAKHDELRIFMQEGEAARGSRGQDARLRRLRLRDRVQGRAAGGPGGRLHRAHLRRQPAPCGPGRGRSRRRGADRRRRGRGGARAAGEGAGEHDEVRGRRDAQLLRDVLGAEGAGASWPGGDAALLAIVPAILASAVAMAWILRRSVSAAATADAAATANAPAPASAATTGVTAGAPGRATVDA